MVGTGERRDLYLSVCVCVEMEVHLIEKWYVARGGGKGGGELEARWVVVHFNNRKFLDK